MSKSRNDRQIDYIEFQVRDIETTKAFYGSVFGWTFQDYGPDYCEFRDGRLTGGFTTQGKPQPGGPLVVLYGDDLPALSRAIEKAGGRIAKPIFDFPGGQRFHFVDPNGYELAVWTAKA
jgi:predicted enzyme related to lactoylglutathione lyase